MNSILSRSVADLRDTWETNDENTLELATQDGVLTSEELTQFSIWAIQAFLPEYLTPKDGFNPAHALSAIQANLDRWETNFTDTREALQTASGEAHAHYASFDNADSAKFSPRWVALVRSNVINVLLTLARDADPTIAAFVVIFTVRSRHDQDLDYALATWLRGNTHPDFERAKLLV